MTLCEKEFPPDVPLHSHAHSCHCEQWTDRTPETAHMKHTDRHLASQKQDMEGRDSSRGTQIVNVLRVIMTRPWFIFVSRLEHLYTESM